jgi:thioredoxin 1
MLQPKITEACEEKKVPLGGINIDEDKELAEEYGVMSIPCAIKFVNGEEADRKIGNVSKESLLAFLG